jgi:LytS/YehU family sensor histidine kinase
MNRSMRFWAGFFGINVTLSLLANLLFGNFGPRTVWRDLFEGTAISTLFSMCCSSLCIVGLPELVPFARRWLGFPLYWGIVVLALIGFASAGSLLALFVLALIGYVPTVDAFIRWFAGSLKTSIVVTLLFGVFGTIIEMLRARLDAATLALRTKERDEADARRIAAEAQLASLESRVQPHFLFNTLNSIAALIHDDPAGAERMTGQLASLLRSSLDQLTPLVPLEEELRTVRNYLEIERVRFGERLRYGISTDPAAAGVRVPRLAVQTLVENSVKYAVSPRREGASIAVRSAANNGHLRIEVEDDGPGFEASALPEGHGLALLRARLAMAFGDAASVRIDSRPGLTCVALDVPTSQG